MMAKTDEREALALAAEFSAARREDWLKLVDGVLKGRPFGSLVTKSHEGIAFGPLHERAAEALPIPGRAPGTPWEIMQRIDHPDAPTANAQALEDLENGASGLTLVFRGGVGCYGFGLPAEAIARALEGVHLEAGIAIECDLGSDEAAPVALAGLLRQRGLAPAATRMRFGIDPLGALAATGTDVQWADTAPRFAARIAELAGQGFAGPFVAADARIVHAAGGGEAQELAFALSVAVTYLRALEAGGLPLDAAREALFFRFAADADAFFTIAKLRAIRRLWARVEEACGLTPRPAFVTAETAWRMMTRRDPHVNLLRATAAVFSAAVGGADAIAVLPFTAALGLPDGFARRLARNTQLLLAEESHLAKVADPAAGSGAIEHLTDDLCRAGWAMFQNIERSGGIAAMLAAGTWQEKIAAVRAARERAVALRTEALTGSTEFPNLAEEPPVVLAPMPPAEARAAVAGHRPALPRKRLAEPFEALRDASDRMLAEKGARPRVFLAPLGSPADFTARLTFARNFFAVGGIEAVDQEALPSPADPEANGDGPLAALARAFRTSGAKLACLCGSDAAYAREAEAAARALARAGAAFIYLAGHPGAHETAWRQAGVTDFIYAGCDALGTLAAVHDRIGLQR